MYKNVQTSMSTGLAGLDKILAQVIPGDNIVFQVDTINDYIPFVHPYCRKAMQENRPLVYFRFADHEQLIPPDVKAEVYQLKPEQGFEPFISEILDVIEEKGRFAYYVFDCLSELSADWYSDRMLANFFMLTCPYLYDWETATYFALLRNHHITLAINTIHDTAQVIIDVYRNKDNLFVHPLKVYKRHSPTMYMLHSWEGDEFVPVTRSTVISEILAATSQPWLDFTTPRFDVWTRTFSQARQCAEDGPGSKCGDKNGQLYNRILRMAVTRDEKLLDLASRYLDLSDLVAIGKRMIGTGLIGGKSVGMLVARAALRKADPRWAEVLEAHDSFFVGSDVFYTYLIVNGCWWVRRRLVKAGTLLDGAEDVRLRMQSGTFPEEIRELFMDMLDYFGQSPIIVRSSSLLEDAYGNAFSGKYESVFCANQGTPEKRLEDFMSAVRTVYASTMKKEALAYRAHWGLLDRDEQMALLVQRVSGETMRTLFFPHGAGVGFSFNPFVWSSDIDPKAGMLRLVFGLGTRAVDRTDDDYTRVVALNAPMKRPESTLSDVRRYAQRHVDVLDLAANRHAAKNFEDIAGLVPQKLLSVFATQDEHDATGGSPVLTFDALLSDTGFVNDMGDMLRILQDAYRYPVDIEFTVNFIDEKNYRINLVQCRPFQVKGELRSVSLPETLDAQDIILRTRGPVIGNSVATVVDRLVYVSPPAYSDCSMSERYSVARLIGKIVHLDGAGSRKTIMILGPGRWGTTTPSLGVPVSFQEINRVSVLCEVAVMHDGLVPDVSLGTHFFNDLVEMDMLYCAVYPDREGYIFNRELLESSENLLPVLLPDAAPWKQVVKVIDSGADGRDILLKVNSMGQEGVCYLGKK